MTCRPISIYAFTRRKIAGHSGHDPAVLEDKQALLLFVGLERARRAGEFEPTVRAVERIEAYFTRTGQRYRLIYAYMYLHLADPKTRTRASTGYGWYEAAYRDRTRYGTHRILTDIWAQHKYESLSDHLLPLCYKGREED